MGKDKGAEFYWANVREKWKLCCKVVLKMVLKMIGKCQSHNQVPRTPCKTGNYLQEQHMQEVKDAYDFQIQRGNW